jgi:hypothetical protein
MIPVVKMRGIDCKSLLAKTDRIILQELVHKEIELIDAAILGAFEAGLSHISYLLPTDFTLNSLSKRDAQVKVYSELLMMYKEQPPTGKGFDRVEITREVQPRLIVGWINHMDASERQQRERYIRECVVGFRAAAAQQARGDRVADLHDVRANERDDDRGGLGHSMLPDASKYRKPLNGDDDRDYDREPRGAIGGFRGVRADIHGVNRVNHGDNIRSPSHSREPVGLRRNAQNVSISPQGRKK